MSSEQLWDASLKNSISHTIIRSSRLFEAFHFRLMYSCSRYLEPHAGHKERPERYTTIFAAVGYCREQSPRILVQIAEASLMRRRKDLCLAGQPMPVKRQSLCTSFALSRLMTLSSEMGAYVQLVSTCIYELFLRIAWRTVQSCHFP